MNHDDDPTPPDLAGLLAELPDEIEPEQDLWQGVSEAIAPVSANHPVRWVWPLAGVAAAAALLLVGALAGRRTVEPMPVTAKTIPTSTDPVDVWEVEVRETTDELLQLVEARRGHLDPEAMIVIEAALVEIDSAIADVRRALRDTPDDGALEVALAEAYDRKVHLLRSAAALEGGG